MKITKYAHATMVVEVAGKKLLIDPGTFTSDFGAIDTTIVAIVVTHVHADHFDPEHITRVAAANPDVQVFATQQVADKLPGHKVTVVTSGDQVTIGPFELQFFGELHAVVHADRPQDQNVGVLVNNTFYYPGDSFTEPHLPVKLLALPVSGPWLKMSEVIDFFAAIKPTQICFLTHDALLSEAGLNMMNSWAAKACEDLGITFAPLKQGESIDI